MKKIKELNKNQKITVIIIIAVFVVTLFSLIRNIPQASKIKADITSLTIKDNNIILNVNSTKQKIINKTKETNISIISNNKELGNNEKISTGNILRYNNTDYEIVVKGDTNKDGNVDIGDLTKLYKIYMNKVEYTNVEGLAADVNSDNKIDISDLIGIYKVYKNPPEEIEDKETYTINFDSNGGSSVSSITRIFGEEIGTLPTSQKEGYIFDGWYTDKIGGTQITSTTKILGNTIYYARWSIRNYNIVYNLNGGQGENPTSYNIETPTFTLNNPTKEGYTFEGWAGSGLTGQNNKVVTITKGSIGDKSYQAIWEEDKTYVVTFDSNGGSNINSKIINDGEELGILLEPTKEGYTFDGWYTAKIGGTKITSSTIVTKNVTYYAHWTVNSYTITFNSNGGSSVNSITKNYGSTIGTLPTSTKQGGTLVGWYTSKTGGTKITSSTTVTGNVTYYAHWTYKDQIHFLNVGSSDAILIESQGKFGLIDASNPKSSSIGYNDSNNYGEKVYNYLNTIGVTHLDFIIASHHHSDHIGGIPELVNKGSLVDSSTTYIYKNNFVDYNGGEVTEGTRYEWKNNQFASAALNAMKSKGAKLYETSSHNTSNSLNISFSTDSPSYKQYITFKMGNYTFKIYNLYINKYTYNGYTTTDENTNSLVTLITTNNSKKALLMGDMNVRDSFEQKYANLIGKVDVLKAGHHGYRYSNSKVLIDKTNPSKVIVPNNKNLLNITNNANNEDFSSARLYLKQKGTEVYKTGDSTSAIVLTFTGSNISVYNANGKILTTASQMSSSITNGWRVWFDSDETLLWYYIKNNSFLTGWQQIDNIWYYFDTSGKMQTGWQQIGNIWYYFDENGHMLTGWQTISSKQYYFYTSAMSSKCNLKEGHMAYSEYIDGKWLGSDGAYTGETGTWQQDSTGWWFKYSSGNYPKNTSLWINGKKYNFNSNGYTTNSNGVCN